MGQYDVIARSAKADIAAAGRNVILRRTSANVYDPATDTMVTAETDLTVKAVVTDYSQYQTDGTIVQAGDKRMLIAALALTSAPALNDIIIDGAVQYRIVDFKTVQPGPVPILYKVQVRK